MLLRKHLASVFGGAVTRLRAALSHLTAATGRQPLLLVWRQASTACTPRWKPPIPFVAGAPRTIYMLPLACCC